MQLSFLTGAQTLKRRSTRSAVSLLLVALSLVAAACQMVQADAAPLAATEAANLASVRRFYEEYSAGNADIILETYAETVTMHYAGEAKAVPAQTLRDDLAALKEANPDLHAVIHDMYASGDFVFTELTWEATHTGDYFGIPATGNPVVHPGIVVRRLENGKTVESWEMWDDLVFMSGLGLTPSWEEIIADISSGP